MIVTKPKTIREAYLLPYNFYKMNITVEIYHKNQKVQNILKWKKENIFKKIAVMATKKKIIH